MCKILIVKKLLSFLAVFLICFYGCAQTKIWSAGPNFWGNYSYSIKGTKIDNAGNVFMLYSTTLSQYGTDYYYLEKFNVQGQRDLTFGTNGVIDMRALLGYTTGDFPFFYSVEKTDDDKLLILLGSRIQENPWLVRINNDGTLDQSFGNNGIKNIYVDPTKYSKHYRCILVKTGAKYFISHTYVDMQNKGKVEVGCFDESMNLITGIFDQGIKQYDLGSPYTGTDILAMRAAGDYLYVQARGYGATIDSNIKRLNTTSGIIDSTYPYNTNLNLESSNAYIQPNGNAIVGNSIYVSSSRYNLQLKKYLVDGTVDTSFGNNGIKIIGYPWIILDYKTMYTLPNGDILVGIKYSSTASSGGIQDALIKFKPNGSLDTTFGGNIPNNGVPLLGFFGIQTIYGAPSDINFKPDYFIVTSTGGSIAISRINYAASTLSSNEVLKKDHFSFYPNPVKTTITAKIDKGENAVVDIYDAQGKLLLKSRNVGNNDMIDFSSYPKGVYILKINVGNKEFSEKIIKD